MVLYPNEWPGSRHTLNATHEPPVHDRLHVEIDLLDFVSNTNPKFSSQRAVARVESQHLVWL